MNPHVRFEEEADAEYRVAGRWYEDHREHLGVEASDGRIAVKNALDAPHASLRDSL